MNAIRASLIAVLAFGGLTVSAPVHPAIVAQVGSPEFRHAKYVSILGESTDGKWLYTAEAAPLNDGDAHIYVWDTTTGKLQAKHYLGDGKWAISAIGLGPEGVRVFEQDRLGQYRLRILNPDTGKTIKVETFWKMSHQPINLESSLDWYTHSDDAAWMIRSAKEGYRINNTATGAETIIDVRKPGQFNGSRGRAFGFARDGKMLYTHDKTVVSLHELPGGKHVGDITRDGIEQHPVGFTPDGKRFLLWVLRSDVWTLEAFDVATKKRNTIVDKRPFPGRVHFAPDGKRFAMVPTSLGSMTPLGDWEIREFATGKELSRVPAIGYAGGVLFSRDGNTFYTKPSENLVVPWNVATGKPTAAAPRILGQIERFRFTVDGKLVGLAGGFVYTWDAKTTNEMARERVPRPIDGYGAATFSPTGDRLHFTAVGDKLIAWDFRAGIVRESELKLKRLANSRIEHWFTPDGSRHVEHRYADSQVVLRDPATGKETAIVSMPAEWRQDNGTPLVFGLALSPDGERLAIGGDNTHSRPSKNGKLPPSVVGVVGLSDSGKAVAAEALGRVSAMAFSSDSRFVVATFSEFPVAELAVWNSRTGRHITRIPLGRDKTRINALRFSPDGRCLAVSLGEHEVQLVETVSWRVRATVTIATQESNVYFGIDRNRDVIAWSPDSNRLATSTLEGGLTIWDVRKLGTTMDVNDVSAVDRAWAALGGDDATSAFAAIRALADRPDLAIPLLKSKVASVPAVGAAKLEALVAGLNSNQFAERERATADLAKLGPLAEAALQSALRTTTSAEMNRRIVGLMDRLASAKITPEELIAVRAVEIAEWINTAASRKLLESWAAGADGARLTIDAKAVLARIKKR